VHAGVSDHAPSLRLGQAHRTATRDSVAVRVAFQFGNTVGTRDKALSRLDGQPARSPTDASPSPSRDTAHGSGTVWVATPSP